MGESAFSLSILPAALKQIQKLPKHVRATINDKITLLATTPQPQMAKPLRGVKNIWRLRVGDYRVLYQIDSKRRHVIVLEVGNRKDVYRGL